MGEDTVIDVADDLAAGELEYLGGIEGDDVVDLLGDDQSVLGRLRLSGRYPAKGSECDRDHRDDREV